MSCCGKKRAQLTAGLSLGLPTGRALPPAPPAPGAAPPARSAAPAVFEYDGPTRITALGPVTRRLYRFDRPHARVEVDARDALAVGAVPHLRRLR